jgi:hypothetical protein
MARSRPYSGAPERYFTLVDFGLSHKHWTVLERLARGTNTLAYYKNLKIRDVKSVLTLGPGHFIFFVTHEWAP